LLFGAEQMHPTVDPLTGLDEPGGQGTVLPPGLRTKPPPNPFGKKTSL